MEYKERIVTLKIPQGMIDQVCELTGWSPDKAENTIISYSLRHGLGTDGAGKQIALIKGKKLGMLWEGDKVGIFDSSLVYLLQGEVTSEATRTHTSNELELGEPKDEA